MSKSSGGGKKKRTYTFKFLNRFIVIQIIAIVLISVFVINKVGVLARDNAVNHLNSIAYERGTFMKEHVENAATLLDSFSKTPQVLELLENPDNRDTLKAAQSYNSAFGGSIENLEGLYIADWNSKTLTHINAGTVGTVIREGERLDALHNAFDKVGDEVFVDTALISPSTGHTVIPLYKAIYDSSNKPVGFVGMGLDTTQIGEEFSEMKTPGLESLVYNMVDLDTREYVFDSTNSENACKSVEDENIIARCDKFDEDSDVEGLDLSYQYRDGLSRYVCSNYYVPEYNWLLTVQGERGEVFELIYGLRMFFLIFTLLVTALSLLYAYLNKRQEAVKNKLLSSVDIINETKKSLNTAMFGDVLTDVGNRIKLATDLADAAAAGYEKKIPYFFTMFNIMEFSNINTTYGNDSGDALLVRTANTLKEVFAGSEIYRTGSDEFIVMSKSEKGVSRNYEVLGNIDKALQILLEPENVQGVGTLYPKYKVAAIKRTTDLDSSVITILKEMTNTKGAAMIGQIDFVDLSE